MLGNMYYPVGWMEDRKADKDRAEGSVVWAGQVWRMNRTTAMAEVGRRVLPHPLHLTEWYLSKQVVL